MTLFISHSRKDDAYASTLRDALVESGFDVWAPQDVSPGDNWARETGRALEKAEAVILLLSPDAVASDLVRQEIEFAISSPRFKNRLIPVLVRPTSEVPWILKELPQWLEAPDPLIAARNIAGLLEKPQTTVSAKAAAAARRQSRADLVKTIAAGTELKPGKVKEVLEALAAIVAADLGRKGIGEFKFAGLMKLKTVNKPASKARKGRNPFTGEQIAIKAKPASRRVRLRALRGLNSREAR